MFHTSNDGIAKNHTLHVAGIIHTRAVDLHDTDIVHIEISSSRSRFSQWIHTGFRNDFGEDIFMAVLLGSNNGVKDGFNLLEIVCVLHCVHNQFYSPHEALGKEHTGQVI